MTNALITKLKISPELGNYYDLVTLPHGHVPVSKIMLWKKLPIPVKEVRTDRTFCCPSCGRPSFFKIFFECDWCECIEDSRHTRAYYERKRRREYFRNVWKRLECLVLPLLVLFGKAHYMRSSRLHHNDSFRFFIRPQSHHTKLFVKSESKAKIFKKQ